MTTPRPYRHIAMTPARAAERLCEAAGTELNPGLVEVFIFLLQRMPAATVIMTPGNDMRILMRGRPRLHGRVEALTRLIYERDEDAALCRVPARRQRSSPRESAARESAAKDSAVP